MRTNRDWQLFATSLDMIRLVLMVDWDPIGVFGYSGALGQYDRYAVGVYDLLCADVSEEELVAHLRRIEQEQIGVRGNSSFPLRQVAAKLRQVFETARAGEEV